VTTLSPTCFRRQVTQWSVVGRLHASLWLWMWRTFNESYWRCQSIHHHLMFSDIALEVVRWHIRCHNAWLTQLSLHKRQFPVLASMFQDCRGSAISQEVRCSRSRSGELHSIADIKPVLLTVFKSLKRRFLTIACKFCGAHSLSLWKVLIAHLSPKDVVI